MHWFHNTVCLFLTIDSFLFLAYGFTNMHMRNMERDWPWLWTAWSVDWKLSQLRAIQLSRDWPVQLEWRRVGFTLQAQRCSFNEKLTMLLMRFRSIYAMGRGVESRQESLLLPLYGCSSWFLEPWEMVVFAWSRRRRRDAIGKQLLAMLFVMAWPTATTMTPFFS